MAIAVVLALAASAIDGVRAGVSAIWGGGIAYAATLLSAAVVLAFRARTPGGALGAQLAGEIVKVVATIALFWVALRRPEVKPLPLIAGFCFTLLGYFVGPALSRRRKNG